jgi:hypothetical protein
MYLPVVTYIFRITIHGWYNTFAGVPQGSILGQLLFLIYVNHIANDLECEMHLYTDDTVLLAEYTTDATIGFEKINRDLERLNEWAIQWTVVCGFQSNKD